MRKPLFALTLVLLLAFSLAGASAKSPRAENFVAPLSGAEEVDPVDTRARGLAKFQLNRDGGELHYRLIVANIENIQQAHIHLAPAGQNGPIVAWLYPEEGQEPELIEGRFNGVLATGTITDADLVGPLAGMSVDDLLQEIKDGETYVNVHTQQNPGGEIRGQIR